MKRIRGYVVSLIAAGTVVAAALPACATNDQSIFIYGVLAPSTNRQGGSCVYTSDPQQPRLFEGVMDIGLTDSYYGVMLLGSQLVARGDTQNNRAESNRIHINGGVVQVCEPDGTLINEFTSLGTGFNDTQNNNSPGYGPVGITLIDAPTRQILLDGSNKSPPQPLDSNAISKSVLVKVKAFGTTLGGVDVESGEYEFPMQICRGCLVVYDGYDATSKTQPLNCDKTPETTASTTGPCVIGQDIAVSCRLCRNRRSPDLCDPNNNTK